MVKIRNITFIISMAALNGVASAQSNTVPTPGYDIDPALLAEQVETPQPPPNLAVAQLIPAYKIALKKGTFEFLGGMGHIDSSKETDSGKPIAIKSTPQTDMFPFQIAYGLTDSANISISGKFQKIEDKVRNSNDEGVSEPQVTLSYTFKNPNSAINLLGTYTPDMGPKTVTAIANSRAEGNVYSGGASGEFQGGYYLRFGPVIAGMAADYIYRDTRVKNEQRVDLFTGQTGTPTQFRYEGGNEKSLLGTFELAFPIRVGGTFGRTWVDQTEEIQVYALTHRVLNSYYRNFMTGYARFQVNPRLSVIPMISYSETPDTTDISSNNDQDLTTMISLRYRF